MEAGRALSPILQWHKHPNDYFSREAQNLYFNSLRTYWQELIDLTRWDWRVECVAIDAFLDASYYEQHAHINIGS